MSEREAEILEVLNVMLQPTNNIKSRMTRAFIIKQGLWKLKEAGYKITKIEGEKP